MKRIRLFLTIMILLGCCACQKESVQPDPQGTEAISASTNETTTVSETQPIIGTSAVTYADSETAVSQTRDTTKGEEVMTDGNKAIIANALGVAEDSRNIRFIVSGLDAIGVGQIRKAELVQENGEDCIQLIAEDQTEYKVYLLLAQ